MPPPKDDDRRRLFSTSWVHVAEEDTEKGAVYRSEDDDIPLSRRPRQRLQLRADGSGTFWVAGPDDRLIAEPASWKEEGGRLVVDLRGRGATRIVEHSADRLVLEKRTR